MKRVLTDTLIHTLVPPPEGRLELADTRCPGLTFRVTRAGARSWCFRFRDPQTGRTTRATLGRYPDLSLAAARDGAGALRRDVARGSNPVAAKRQARASHQTTTFAHLAARYLDEHARRTKRSAAADERNLRLHVLPRWGSRSFTAIGRGDVIALVESLITAGKPTLANRVQALVSSIFTFAVDAALVDSNPCARLRRRGVERRGERVLTDDELQLFWSGIVRPPVSRLLGLALRLQLLLGVRPGEVAGMRRDELEYLEDPARAGWLIPAGRMKAKRPHYVPLPPPARVLIAEALALAPADQPFVFASPRAAGAIRANALPVAMQRFGQALEGTAPGAASWAAAPPSPHDLRRTVATRLSALGVPGEDVAAVLAHATAGVTKRHYDHYDRAREKRHALALWNDALTAVLEGRSYTAGVVPLRPGCFA
jgi:integrase